MLFTETIPFLYYLSSKKGLYLPNGYDDFAFFAFRSFICVMDSFESCHLVVLECLTGVYVVFDDCFLVVDLVLDGLKISLVQN